MLDNKKRVVTIFEKLDNSIQEQIKFVYPDGFSHHLIKFTNKDGELVSALRFETDEMIYLIKMSTAKAEQIISDDDDYNDEGFLKKNIRETYENKFSELDYILEQEEDYSDDDEDDEL